MKPGDLVYVINHWEPPIIEEQAIIGLIVAVRETDYTEPESSYAIRGDYKILIGDRCFWQFGDCLMLVNP